MRVRPTSLAALAAVAALTACTTSVAGVATPAGGLRMDATDADLVVELAEEGNETDRIARNAAADVLDYWEQTFPEVYGGEFGELEGGFWSIDPDETDGDDLPSSPCFDDDVDELAENAFYCGSDDRIVYDRAWLADLAEDYGPFMIAEVMAHEMGHAVQEHAEVYDSSIVAETQAECFAGGWTRWVVEGNSRHFAVRPAELDGYLLSYLYFGDPAGSDPDDPSAHGSLFDQLSAFQEGYADGPQACAAFDDERVYTLEPFDREEEGTQGDLPYGRAVRSAASLLSAFWDQALGKGFADTPALGRVVQLPEVVEGEPSGSACTGGGPEVDVEYCADGSVRFDAPGLLQPAHDEVGDYAVVALLGLPYATAVRAQLGLPADGVGAVDAVVCTTGWMARELFRGDVAGGGASISPGDVDEAAVALLRYGEGDNVLPASDSSGFELVDAFRQGFLGGTCGL
ncbi:neutral zinc metallopeptidase [Blastococcus sp. URHD0036]|uniref:neutral zinc metallopeptidase n=1 Tax=Blastococcus sp. URHD0036 TaxID=1380356 RepID=UPI0004981B15|nr:neutral zinc metallopeptidase [Blastococcus sp. URHD0036]